MDHVRRPVRLTVPVCVTCCATRRLRPATKVREELGQDVASWLVENGKISAPIKDVSISGNGPETLARISMVANDACLDVGGWTCGKNGQNVPVSQGVPTVLVSNMTLGPGAAT